MDISLALETIYKNYFNLFLAMGFRYRLDKETVKEMIQETFTKAFLNIHTIRATTEAELRSFVIRIFRNQCLLHLRNTKKHLDLKEFETGLADEKCNPLYEILLIEEMRLRQLAISLIEPEKYREPVRLYLGGRKPGEIATCINRNPSTTRNLIHRGLKIFERMMTSLDPLRKS